MLSGNYRHNGYVAHDRFSETRVGACPAGLSRGDVSAVGQNNTRDIVATCAD